MGGEREIKDEYKNTEGGDKNLRDFYEKTFRDLEEGEVIRGKVVEVGKEFVTIDVGYKSEGQIPISEFYTRDHKLEVKKGDEIDVFLERREDEERDNVQKYFKENWSKKMAKMRKNSHILE